MNIEKIDGRTRITVEDFTGDVGVEADGGAVRLSLDVGPFRLFATLSADDARRVAEGILAAIDQAVRLADVPPRPAAPRPGASTAVPEHDNDCPRRFRYRRANGGWWYGCHFPGTLFAAVEGGNTFAGLVPDDRRFPGLEWIDRPPRAPDGEATDHA